VWLKSTPPTRAGTQGDADISDFLIA